MADDAQYGKALAYARDLGAEHGTNAAAFATQYLPFGGRDTAGDPAGRARRILAQSEDGDPAFYDEIPSADLSGQWADTLTGPRLVEDALAEAGYTDEDTDAASDLFSDICDAYETAFDTAAEDEVVRFLRHHLDDAAEHVHSWGPVEYARFTGNPHRKCEGCAFVSLDLSDEDDEA